MKNCLSTRCFLFIESNISFLDWGTTVIFSGTVLHIKYGTHRFSLQQIAITALVNSLCRKVIILMSIPLIFSKMGGFVEGERDAKVCEMYLFL